MSNLSSILQSSEGKKKGLLLTPYFKQAIIKIIKMRNKTSRPSTGLASIYDKDISIKNIA